MSLPARRRLPLSSAFGGPERLLDSTCMSNRHQPARQRGPRERGPPGGVKSSRPPWKLTPEWVNEAIDGSTRMLLLIDPINPLGTAYTKDEVRALGVRALVRQVDVAGASQAASGRSSDRRRSGGV